MTRVAVYMNELICMDGFSCNCEKIEESNDVDIESNSSDEVKYL